MFYYQFNIGDYRADTAHLSIIEHGIYRQLIDWYYLDEKPIPKETQVVMRRLCLGSDELHLLQNILSDFFILTDLGYCHTRVEREIHAYHGQAAKNRVNGKLGGRPRKTQVVISGKPTKTQVDAKHNPNQEPLTNNHKPIVTRATRLSINWMPTDEMIQFCRKERSDLDPILLADKFRDYWIAKAGKDGAKLDWFATWRNWVRNQNGHYKPSEPEKGAAYSPAVVPMGKHDASKHADGMKRLKEILK